jgi:hypothetical protein
MEEYWREIERKKSEDWTYRPEEKRRSWNLNNNSKGNENFMLNGFDIY